ncbi:putative white-brown complex homolog protein 30 isoform X2 [Jatropha curcas]|uniref:putative white-brown complex homolog protein 30 isoform X2 n=1 Tax=Jatropha curcas TaxID=180498 RepID=UPI0009D6B3F3|nr:putative white-brown complex homolog protein 30 isoform X2 [Jatropha curcas]
MSRVKINIFWVLLLLFIVLNLVSCVRCVEEDEYRETGNPALVPVLTEMLYNRLSNLSTVFSDAILETSNFCIKNVKKDWDGAFNFKGQLDFLTNCIKKTKGDVTHRLCNAAEINFYFSSHFIEGATSANFLEPNKNCNLSSWPSGCEPGWSCTTSQNQKVDLEDLKDIPTRTNDCQPCCEGFFCPQGLTCMIPCPLGSYCPVAKLNKATGVCEPYSYQIPPGQPNHTCGSADIWSHIGNSDIFCPPGSYCPTTTLKVSCSTGHYCMRGSTSQKSCFKLTTCKPNTANQNLHAYGVILIVALTTLLLIIVNWSDQALSVRERKAAKHRELALRQAKETAQARERWKAAKDVAKQRALGLQAQLSRTFSRQRSRTQPEQLTVQVKHRSEDVSTSTSSPSEQSPSAKEPSNLTKMMRAIEDDPNSQEGFNLETGDKNVKKNMPKGKKLHSHSQIFKYAYGQLEKERAMQEQQKNLTFSGVISMATEVDIKTRPVIEVAFKDLTLTLKGKKKHLLRCVTGKIMPGRVSAVMGPSGAGKTTFLSALAGKVTGCTVTGLILINGKNESIHSYKKIIGFVPQDDIVHGNLTVEENLRFSARCRLSADMPKADKVLVIERVIESLGLQAIRDSLVGTVEKRGISGGQRKRVNVGLEMVMEPSLLILDEPTSGLDSASSMLLLRALRREALEGVNISMVVHQPSYSLFKMFDDFILLAKGGLTVYHGPTKKVEEYFSGLGITVPDRVTPPDHFIDILEGIVKPNSNVTHEQLPIRWMLHNGYAIPPDMLKYADSLDTTSTHSNTSNTTDPNAEDTEHSFAGDLWEDVKYNVELQKDRIQYNFLRSKDLSYRRTPSVGRQFRYFLGRVCKQRLREARLQAVDYLILLLAGACLGTLTKVDDETFGSSGYTFTVIAVSLLCKIAALRSFSQDKLHYWRERAGGISSLAYFLSKDTLDHFNTIVKPMVYLSMFYFFNNPRSTFTDNYIVLVCLVYCVTGIAYIFAIYLPPSTAQLEQTGLVKHLGTLCYPKWAMEAFIIANAERYSGVWLITRCHSLMQNGYDLGHRNLCLELLILTGILSRFTAYFMLITFQKR